MQQYDVLIIGGGPAGSSLAWRLRNSKLKLAIMDKASFPRDKVCAGWVTPAVMDALQIDLVDYSRSRTLQEINGFRVSQTGQKQIETHYENKPVSYGIRRREFDDYLLRRCGAELILDTPFNTMQRTGTGWRVNDEIEARLVIGAGGHFCPVARSIGARHHSSEQVVAAQEVEFAMTPEQVQQCAIKAEVPELFFTPDLSGYGWVFRKGDYLNIGLGREDSRKLGSHVQDFCRYLQDSGKIPFDITDKFHGHAYLLYPHARRDLVMQGVMLIGDAAGLAYPQSGEGIRPAVESGLIAAGVIEECGGDYSAESLHAYERKLTQRLGQRQPAPDLMERLPLRFKQLLARQLMQTRWFTGKFVIERWFLQSGLPALSVKPDQPDDLSAQMRHSA